MEELLALIDAELRRLRLERQIQVAAEPYHNGHPNSHIRITGEVSSFFYRQIVDQAVLRLLPDTVHLLSEIKVKG